MGRLIPMRAIFAMQRAVALKDRHSKGSLRYYSNYQPDFLYVTVEKDWCDQVVDMDFEDTRLMAPAGWHEILTEVYGDYMTPPPKEQQVPTHSGRRSRCLAEAEERRPPRGVPYSRGKDSGRFNGQESIGCSVRLQRRKGIGRILQGNG